MIIYLAGTYSRSYVVKEAMDVYLAGPSFGSIKHFLDDMNVYLALANQGASYPRDAGHLDQRLSILESFYYIADWMLPYIANHWNFLLDSGAFTFFGKGQGGIDWDSYVARYAEFINEYKIDKFFEMDIDTITNTKHAEQLRTRIERLTGRQSIPVWRPMRGYDYWQHMIREYPYVAISASGAYDSRWARQERSLPILRQMIAQAHEQDTKVHGLGYTSIKNLAFLGWDSVDSTTWVYGNMSGKIYKFTGDTVLSVDKPEGMRIRSAREAAVHNFLEWVKFQRYAYKHL